MKDKAVVEEVYKRHKSSSIPTMLKFQNGNLVAVTKENVQYCRIKDRKTNAENALIIANEQAYCGTVNEGNNNALTDSYICVRSKSTNKVRIIPIDFVTMKNQIYKKLEETPRAATSNADVMKQKLMKEFGGRKASRIFDDKEKMKISMDIVKDDLEATLNETSVKETTATQDEKSHMEVIAPKFNKDAAELEDIYDLNDLIPHELMETMDEEAKAVYLTSLDNLPIFSKYLGSVLTEIQANGSASVENLKKIKIIIFMDCLYNLMKTQENYLLKTELSGITTKVEKDIRERFGGPTGRRNKTGLEKALCYYIGLGLILSEKFEVDAGLFARDLEKSVTVIKKYGRLVNAMPKANAADVLKMRLPKDVPALKQRGRKRKA